MNKESIRLTIKEAEDAVEREWRVDFREPIPSEETTAAIANTATDKAIRVMIKLMDEALEGECIDWQSVFYFKQSLKKLIGGKHEMQRM